MPVQAIEDLRDTIRLLKPEGADGFEGLVAAVLADLTKRSFALASSGSQQGRDGQSALDSGAVIFEAKRYDDNIAKDKIYTKIFEIAASDDGKAELFILGATSPVSTQYINTLRRGGERLSIPIIVWAWPETGLPELASALAMTPEVSADFVSAHIGVPKSIILQQLEAVRAHPQFAARSDEIRSTLQQPSIAPAFALIDNVSWLNAAFSNRRRARSVFGQPLSPGDTSVSGVLDRQVLRDRCAQHIFSKPDGSITAILGADGNGKSWIFAQAWTAQTPKPLTVVCVPDDIIGPPTMEGCEDLLLTKLCTQTGDTLTRLAKDRWTTHFERWRKTPGTDKPRIVVFVDGLNQREQVKWLPFMDAMSELLASLGGKLVFSCRRLFYQDHLDGRLVSRVLEINIPEWTDPELELLLQARGTSTAALDTSVVRSLRNPRIFGIAAELYRDKEVSAFEELSVNRLLFQHIYSGTAVSPDALTPTQFAAEICNHAEKIVVRLQEKKVDATEFEIATALTPGPTNQPFSERFVITSAGRFFEIVPENPNKYLLKDDGLPLALGLALVRAARAAHRKNQNVEEALSNILDPIAALDRTGDILLGAILSSVLEKSPADIVAPLVRSFVRLQNLDASRYAEFKNLFRHDPLAFLSALGETALVEDVTSNLLWLTEAAQELRSDPAVDAALANAIHRWLNIYSLAPERMMLIPSTSEYDEERRQKRADREAELAKTVASLSQPETDLLGFMTREDRGDYSRLNRLAFQFLAGRSLAPFAGSLRNWCLSASLNGGYYDHHDDLDNLLHFNLTDWAATKDALRAAATVLRQGGMSRTGQWALVYVLRGTGDSADALEADAIAEELTKDREHRPGWRMVENYCTTDPCDPASVRPENIDKTAENYRALDAAGLRRFMSSTQEDHFFDMARPGLARFEPSAAIAVMRRLADQAVLRSTEEFRQAAFMLENHTAALEDRIAPVYVAKAKEIAQEALDVGEDKNNQFWVAAQYALLVAFPHMSGQEQFDALVSHPKDRTILMDLGYVMLPIDPAKYEAALESAVKVSNAVTQFRVLAFAEFSRTPLTDRAKDLVVQLLASPDDHVRLSALGLIRTSEHPDMLAALVATGWSAANLDAVDQKVEILHGSQALVLAAQQGLLSIEACLERIALSSYRMLAERLGREAALAVADRLNTAIHKAALFQVQGNLPDIQQSFEGRHWSIIYEVSDKPMPEGTSPHERLSRQLDIGDAWYERQKRNRDAAEKFERDLTKAGAQIIIQSVEVGLILEIDKVAPAIVDEWRDRFLKLDQKALNNVHNIASVVAEATAKRDAAAGMKLFERLAHGSPHVRVTFGRDQLDLDAVTVWGAAESPEMRALRFARLDRIGNDYDLTREILAAVRAKRLDILRDYVLDRRSRPEPAHRARAAMVAGLSPDVDWAIETLGLLKGEHGFLKRAYDGAKYAMDRHQWSRHWAKQMQAETDPGELWRYSVLLAKIVDGRFEASDVEGESPSPLIRRFGTTMNDLIRNRINKWKSKREDKLFGMKTPDKMFLPTP